MYNLDLDYNEPIEIASGIYWVGYADIGVGLHCNPYLIVDNGEAVLIDSGSRDDFSTVMLKIMRAGVNPKMIKRLIYQHYDPDLCGNIPHMEAMIDSEELRILSHYENNIFIRYYSSKAPKDCIEDLGFEYKFSSGRVLRFIRTPYSHSPGSFVTYDTKTKVLFSSDIFGSYDYNWDLYSKIEENCIDCLLDGECALVGKRCQIVGMINFHRRNMTSSVALRYALNEMAKEDISLIAPQHGSLLNTPSSIKAAFKHLMALDEVGIEDYLKEVKP